MLVVNYARYAVYPLMWLELKTHNIFCVFLLIRILGKKHHQHHGEEQLRTLSPVSLF